MKKTLTLLSVFLIAIGFVFALNPQNKSANSEKNDTYISSNSHVNGFSTVILKDCSLEVKTEDEKGSLNWNEAKSICEAFGQGWRLPDKDELNCLYKNKDKIGGFKRDWYWSSGRVGQFNVWVQSFSNGKQFGYSAGNSAKLRCVRSLTK